MLLSVYVWTKIFAFDVHLTDFFSSIAVPSGLPSGFRHPGLLRLRQERGAGR